MVTIYDLRDSAYYYGLKPSEYYETRIPDLIAYVRSASKRAESVSREQWSVMRYQTAVIAQMMQDGKSKPIQPTDILKFEDEIKAEEDKPRSLTKAQGDKLDAIYERYLKRQKDGV